MSKDDITAKLKKLKFHKKLFGGVDEIDVWKKLEEIHCAYQTAAEPPPDEAKQVIRQKRQALYDREDIRSFFVRLILMILILFVLFGVIFGITPMKDDDMKPRISAGDLMFYFRLEPSVNNSDVWVYEKDGQQYTGRIVAQPGDKVEITRESELKINDNIMWEMDIYYDTPQYDGGIEFPVTLGQDQYFILCDYREGGKDSRYLGPVTKEDLKGKIIAVLRRSGL